MKPAFLMPITLASLLLSGMPAALHAQTTGESKPASAGNSPGGENKLTDDEKLELQREKERNAVKVNRSATQRSGERLGTRVSKRRQ